MFLLVCCAAAQGPTFGKFCSTALLTLPFPVACSKCRYQISCIGNTLGESFFILLYATPDFIDTCSSPQEALFLEEAAQSFQLSKDILKFNYYSCCFPLQFFYFSLIYLKESKRLCTIFKELVCHKFTGQYNVLFGSLLVASLTTSTYKNENTINFYISLYLQSWIFLCPRHQCKYF